MNRCRSSFVQLLLLVPAVASAAPAQDSVEIVHDPIDCWPIDQFLVVRSAFEPPAGIQTAKFYFRSTAHPDYYFIELTLSGEGGRAIVPKADPDTSGVVYYVELVTDSFSAFRTEEYSIPVASGSECRQRDPGAAYYTGQNPDIGVGSTRFGVPKMPPGFQADGISRFISAGGISGEAGAGGGLSGKTVAIIAGAGGGAGAAAFLASGGGGSVTTTGIGGVTTTTTSSTSTAIGGGSTSTTTTVGGGGSTSSPTTTSAGGSTTTTVAGGSTTTTSVITSSTTTIAGTSSTTTSVGTSTTSTPGSSTTASSTSTTTTSIRPTTTVPSTTTPGSTTTTSPPTTTTSAPPTTTTSPPASTADLSVTKSGPTTADVGAEFAYSITIDNLGPAEAKGILVSDNWTAGLAMFMRTNNPKCAPIAVNRVGCNIGSLKSSDPPVTIRLTLRATSAGTLNNNVSVQFPSPPTDPARGNNSDSVTTRILPLTSGPSQERDMPYRSRIEVDPRHGRVRAQIVVNGSSFQETDDSGEFTYTARVKDGVNRVDTQLVLSDRSSGFWRFDFGGSPDFVAGSFRVESGSVLSRDSTSVTFVMGAGAPPPRYTFEVGEGRRGRPQNE